MANSKIYLGSTNIGSLFQGADDISIYLGENKVYPLEEPFKWKATYQDLHVESAQCDSSSAITHNDINKTNLVSVEIGNCVTSIDNIAFGGCTSLTSINIPNSVTSIGNGTFNNCISLTSCTIGNSVTSIGSSAFEQCDGLASIDIPNSVTSIGYDAFYGCDGLTSIEIPDSITSIGHSAFQSCSSLTSITVEATTPPTLEWGAFDDTNNCPIYVPCESVNTYKAASEWSRYTSRITCLNPPTYTYYVDIKGLEGKDTCDIDWKNIKIDYSVGNGSYTITTTADTVDVSITNYDDRSYSVDYDSFTLTSNNPGKLVTFTYQGGGNLQYIPQGTDMTQYYNRTITRFKIGDSSLSSDYSQVRPTFQTGGYGQIDAWGGVNLNFGGTQITSLPCDVSGSDTLTEWVCLDSNWTSSNNNPFTDLWIEFA